MTNRQRVSLHEIEVFRVLRASDGAWMSNRDIESRMAIETSARTVRATTSRFAEQGIVDERPTFPGFRYKLSNSYRRSTRVREIEAAAEAAGVELAR